MPDESKTPLKSLLPVSHANFFLSRKTLLIKLSLLLSFPTTLSSPWLLCFQSSWCTPCLWHCPCASLPTSPYMLMPFVSFSFQHFWKTCFLCCAKKALISVLTVLSKKSQLQSQLLLFHSLSSHHLSDSYHTSFVLPLFVKSTSVVSMCSWTSSNSFACHCSMSGTYWSSVY